MAAEGNEQVVDQPGGAPSTTGAEKPVGTDSVDKPASGSGPAPDKSAAYEKQLAGMRADLQKERKSRQDFENQFKTTQSALEAEKKRVALALGINPQSPEDLESEQIRAAFAQRFPDLASLTKEDIEALRSLRNTQGSLEETTKHYWTQHGRQMVGGVQAAVAKELGGDLSDRQMQRIAAAYALEAENNKEFLQRHERGDKSLIAEFAKQWVEDWFEPARRKVTQQEVVRQRVVPGGKDRGLVTHGEKKIDVNDNEAVMDLLVKGRRERGEVFGRR